MIRVSRIIGELDTVIDAMRSLRRELLVSQKNEAALARIRQEHQANQHGDNPMGGDGEAR